VVIDRSAIPGLPDKRGVGVHEVEVRTYQGDAVCLRVTPAQADDERGAYAQHRLQTKDYPSYLSKPLRDVVVFDAYRGRQYSCNPRAVYERLKEQGTDLDCVWITRDGQYETPDGARTVLIGTREHYELMATSRYLVCNGVQPPWFEKRDDQIYVQCWHGTPLKRIGWDAPIAPHRREQAGKLLHQEVVRWDVLVSPNPFTSQVMRRAYQYKGEILESGYPRNDVLNSTDRERIAVQTRERLGIPDGKKVVLYAPTWRDDDHIAAGRHKFDLALDLEHARHALGDDHVVLLRTHYSTTDRSWSQVDGFAIDVSKYPDMAELNLVADVLVTDYSSALFDFAVTGKPMVFFTYDLESYRDRAPGFCFDFEAEAPGPLVRTSEEAVAAIQKIDDAARDHADAYAAFTAKFCPYDDGHAAERVIKRFLELGEGR
jgi:CDP-glycerol glycerophosphotransferase